MINGCRIVLGFLSVVVAALGVVAAEPEIKPADLPLHPAVEPADAVSTFELKEGFRLETAAAEPRVTDPVALSFDEKGRMFVVEMRDYSERRDERLGRVRMLEDKDGDGSFETATVFAQDLAWPTGILCYDGGVFVVASPDILHLKDNNNDGVADERKVVFTGFGNAVDRLNVQALPNSFNWGLDNRIYGAASMNGGKVASPLRPEMKAIDLRGKGFSFDPRTLDLRAENGGGQHGASFDPWGRLFVCSNSHHVQTHLYDLRYSGRNPAYAMPSALVDIAVDGPAAEVYRISPEEAWRVIRTKWRVSGVVPGIVEGGGRSAGYFTGATGVTIYRGDAWGPGYVGDAFTGDAGGNLVHRKKVRRQGLEIVAERPADEKTVEFLASRDTWFRPVQFANAPDGCLYVLDMYRQTIEHPWSLPASIKRHLDLNRGNDRGRIYRIAPEQFERRPAPDLGRATSAELAATLAHPNGWHRDAAARLLFERQDKAATPALEELLGESESALGRMHAMYALRGMGALTEGHVAGRLKDADPHVREHAIRLSEDWLREGTASAKLTGGLSNLAADPDVAVRYQLVLSLGTNPKPQDDDVVIEIAKRDFNEKWMRAAVLGSPAVEPGKLFRALVATPKVMGSHAGTSFLTEAATLVGAKNRPEDVAGVLAFAGGRDGASLRLPLLRALGEGLRRAGKSLADVGGGELEDIFAETAAVAADASADEAMRVQAVQLLGMSSYAASGDLLAKLIDQRQPQAVQSAAVGALDRFADAKVGDVLVGKWKTMTPKLRSEALGVLLKRPERARTLLQAVAAEKIGRRDIPTTETAFLRNSADRAVRDLAAAVLGADEKRARDDVVKAFLSAVETAGDAARGRELFTQRCASCHRAGGEGFALGPDLVTVKTSGREKLLTNILDPNREVQPNYTAFLVETKDGDSLLGIVTNETAGSVTVRQAFGNETVVPRANINKVRSQGQTLMPEGLEEGLKVQDVADLLEFIEKAEK